MSTRNDRRWLREGWRALTAVTGALALGSAVHAGEMPKDFSGHAVELHAALAAEIGRPVYVLEATFGPHYAQVLVQDQADPQVYDKYSAAPGDHEARTEPVKVGSVSCPKVRIAFDQLRLEAAVAALADAQPLASGNGFEPSEVISYGPDVFCKNPAWRLILSGPGDSDDMLELLYSQEGRLSQARRFDGERWKKVDVASLRHGAVVARTAAPEPEQLKVAGDGRKRDFRAQPLEAVALLEHTLGAPLRLLDADFDSDRATFKVVDAVNKKRLHTYFVAADGTVEEWRAEDAIAFDCIKPFSPAEVPIARLPAMIEFALGAIPPMRDAKVDGVRIYRSGFCSAPHVYIKLEDERATGDVEFDAKGKLVSAAVR